MRLPSSPAGPPVAAPPVTPLPGPSSRDGSLPAAASAGVRTSVDPRSDRELAEAAAGGDTQAFGVLVERTQAQTWTLARRLTGNAHDAADVTQDAYLRAFRSIGSWRGDAAFGTWMHRITVNCAATHAGRRHRHRHDPLPEDAELSERRPGGDPVLAAEASALRDELAAALDALPPKLRAVVVLRDVYELPHDVVADELGISVTAAKVRLHRARHRLRDALFCDTAEATPRDV